MGPPIERPANLETTAVGAAFLAGLGAGLWSGLPEIAATWQARDRFTPAMVEARRAAFDWFGLIDV